MYVTSIIRASKEVTEITYKIPDFFPIIRIQEMELDKIAILGILRYRVIRIILVK